jgi:hypothetical protein
LHGRHFIYTGVPFALFVGAGQFGGVVTE